MLNGNITAGSLMSFLATTQTIQRSLFQLSLLYGHYIKVTTSLSHIFEYLSLETVVDSGRRIGSVNGLIQFKNVNFSYPKRPDQKVLKNLNLTFKDGKVTALVGSSGSGKSTIAMLIENLYDLSSGTVLLDGHDMSGLSKDWLRKEVIGYISQEPILFCTSIMENVKYGLANATEQQIIQACKSANAHEFITQFSHGYQTVVGQQGTSISGGQRQRIAIARAIVKDPKILILDEATSALDPESEALVKDALDKVMKGRTVVVIAHRLSTIKNADHIIVIDKGVVVEQGTHSQLLNRKGQYFNLIKKSLDSNQDVIDDA